MKSAIDDLKDGYRRFCQTALPNKRTLYRDLAGGQSPRVMIIACADSRVDPSTIFDARPGELFVVRNVANLVPPCRYDTSYHGTSAAIEFAVTGLEVEHIVVLGHGQCGGIRASLARADQPKEELIDTSFVGAWVSLLDSARDRVLTQSEDATPEDRQRQLEHAAIGQSIDSLLTFPFVNTRVAAGQLTLEGAWFSIAEAALHWRQTDGTFVLTQ